MAWWRNLNPFTAASEATECRYVIRDDIGTVSIDREYAELGESEGWLAYFAYRQHRGYVVLEYRHTPPIVWPGN